MQEVCAVHEKHAKHGTLYMYMIYHSIICATYNWTTAFTVTPCDVRKTSWVVLFDSENFEDSRYQCIASALLAYVACS